MTTETPEVRTLPRAVVVPLVLAAVLISTLVTFEFWGIAELETHPSPLTLPPSMMPDFCRLFYKLLPLVWTVPVLALVIGIDLCRRRQTSQAYVAWYGALCVTGLVFWLAFGNIAFHLVHSNRDQIILERSKLPTSAPNTN